MNVSIMKTEVEGITKIEVEFLEIKKMYKISENNSILDGSMAH